MLRSIGVVLAGYVSMAAVVTLGTLALGMIFIPGGLTAMRAMRDNPTAIKPSPRYLAANLTLSFAAACLAGWVTALIANAAPFQHALALAGFGVVMGVVNTRGTRSRPSSQPRWYAVTIIAIGVAGVLLGGWIRTR